MAKKQRNQGNVYADFAREFDFCWQCGWREGRFDTGFWHVKLDVAHVVGGSGRRKKDRRAIVRLCQFPCHRLAHGDVIRHNGLELPKLTMANLLWLKREYDPDYFDPFYIARIQVGEDRWAQMTEEDRVRALTVPEEPEAVF